MKEAFVFVLAVIVISGLCWFTFSQKSEKVDYEKTLPLKEVDTGEVIYEENGVQFSLGGVSMTDIVINSKDLNGVVLETTYSRLYEEPIRLGVSETFIRIEDTSVTKGKLTFRLDSKIK